MRSTHPNGCGALCFQTCDLLHQTGNNGRKHNRIYRRADFECINDVVPVARYLIAIYAGRKDGEDWAELAEVAWKGYQRDTDERKWEQYHHNVNPDP